MSPMGILSQWGLWLDFIDGDPNSLSSDLAASLGELEERRNRKNVWPPDNNKVDPEGKGLQGVMEDELGFVD